MKTTPLIHKTLAATSLPTILLLAVLTLTFGATILRAGERPFDAFWFGGLESSDFASFHGADPNQNMHLGKSLVEFDIADPLFDPTIGHLTFIAANGDLLFADVEAVGFDLLFYVLFDGPLVFTGGTGRFEGATGNAQLTMVIEGWNFFKVSITGTINY